MKMIVSRSCPRWGPGRVLAGTFSQGWGGGVSVTRTLSPPLLVPCTYLTPCPGVYTRTHAAPSLQSRVSYCPLVTSTRGMHAAACWLADLAQEGSIFFAHRPPNGSSAPWAGAPLVDLVDFPLRSCLCEAYRERLEGKGSPDWLWEVPPTRFICVTALGGSIEFSWVDFRFFD